MIAAWMVLLLLAILVDVRVLHAELIKGFPGAAGNIPKEVKELKGAAAGGSTEAAWKLGLVLIQGKLVPADLSAAENWLRKALAGGELRARLPLANLLLATSNKGRNVERAAEGLGLLRAGAKSDPGANLALGLLYAKGQFVKADFALAEEYFGNAARLESATGWYRLGWLHSGEAGYSENARPEEAVKHLETAFSKGEIEAGRLLVKLLREGVRVKKDEERAFRIVADAADRGDPRVRHFLAELHEQGAGTPKDPGKALLHYRQAAEAGYAPSQNRLGLIYAKGNQAAKVDPEEARQWFRRSAEQGFPAGAYNLALLMAEAARSGDAKAEEEAVTWLIASANAGFTEAQDRLGSWYRDGTHVAKDVLAASSWFRQAANAGYIQAKVNLAQLLEVIQKDSGAIETAFSLYRDSAAAGHPVAHFELARLLASGTLGRIELGAAHAYLSTAAEAGFPPAIDALSGLTKRINEEQLAQSTKLQKNLEATSWKKVSAPGG